MLEENSGSGSGVSSWLLESSPEVHEMYEIRERDDRGKKGHVFPAVLFACPRHPSVDQVQPPFVAQLSWRLKRRRGASEPLGPERPAES